jgi:hypothetical protein
MSDGVGDTAGIHGGCKVDDVVLGKEFCEVGLECLQRSEVVEVFEFSRPHRPVQAWTGGTVTWDRTNPSTAVVSRCDVTTAIATGAVVTRPGPIRCPRSRTRLGIRRVLMVVSHPRIIHR